MDALRTATAYLKPSILCAALIVPACAGVGGSDPPREAGVAREVAHFTRIEASGPIDLRVELGGSLAVTVEAGLELVTEVAGGTLRLWFPEGAPSGRVAAVQVSAPHIDALACSKGASARLAGLEGGRIDLALEGAGSIRASGSVEHLVARIDGSGALDLESLPAREADVVVRGSGRAQLSVSGALDAEVEGNGSVVYRGDPIVWAGGSGAGNVKRR